MSGARQAASSARAAYEAFANWRNEFREISRRGDRRFVERDWRGLTNDVVERLDVYTDEVTRLAGLVRSILGARVHDRALWARVAADYAHRVQGGGGRELAVTFFNSLTRRIFESAGVGTPIELLDPGDPPAAIDTRELTEHPCRSTPLECVRDLLGASPLAGLFAEPEPTASAIATEIERAAGSRPILAIAALRPLFYRGSEAFLVGRVIVEGGALPLAISFLNFERGAVVDAVLLEEDEISVVFSFTRSYFLVDVEEPADVVPFLRQLMPKKPVAELYTAIGHNRHGKTVFYRDLVAHLAKSDERFVAAPGDRGLVMIVFTMPSYDIVFKIIRDRIPPPKTVVREDVRSRYRLVFRHDRAGRLADAHEFERLRFDERRFSPELLDELRRDARETVLFDGGAVVLEHVYTERRMQPLNLYLQRAAASARRAAVLDYGRAVRDLAASNIFPGDLLLKNFGVTRHGRVVFYDYDELCLLTDVHFRDLPSAGTPEDELRAESWFYVGPRDVFPEEFRTFIGLPRELLEIFEQRHGELFDAAWWRGMQGVHRNGIVTRILPYPRSRRLVGPGSAQPSE